MPFNLTSRSLDFVEKNPKISFPVKQQLVLQKNKTYALKLQQLDIEEKCTSAKAKLDVVARVQNDVNLIPEGITAISDALKILSAAKNDAQNIPELAELVDFIHQKMIRARQSQQQLQDKLDSLLSLVPTTSVTIVDEDLMDSTKANPVKSVTHTKRAGKVDNPLKIAREYELVGGQVRFKFRPAE